MTAASVPVPAVHCGANQADVERVLFDALDHYLDVLVVQMVEDADEQAQADADVAERLLRVYQARLSRVDV